MITFYYDIKVPLRGEEPGFFKVEYQGNGDAVHRHPASLAYSSERIWEERNEKVAFIKNRDLGAGADVDLEEFMWVKLAAKQL